MRVSRILAGAVLTTTAVMMPAASAFADSPVVTLDPPTQARAGESVDITATGCPANKATATSPIIPGGSLTLEGSGNTPSATGRFRIPFGTMAGAYSITVACDTGNLTPSVKPYTVLPPRNGGGDGGNDGGNDGNDGRDDHGRGDNGRGDNGRGDHGRGDNGRGDNGRGDHGRGDHHGGGFDPCDDSGWGDDDSWGGDNGRGDHGRGDSGRGDSGRGDSGWNKGDDDRENGRGDRPRGDRGESGRQESQDKQDYGLDESEGFGSADGADGKNTDDSWDGGQNGGGWKHDKGDDDGWGGDHGRGDNNSWNNNGNDDCDTLAARPAGSPHTGVGGSVGGLNTTETAIGTGLLAAVAGGGIYMVRRRRMNGGQA